MEHVKEPQICVGQELFFSLNLHYISLKCAVGQGTNNQAEFYPSWILLKTTAGKGLKDLQVFGDSKMLMDWTNHQCRIENMLLVPIMNQVLELKHSFDDLSFLIFTKSSTQKPFGYIRKLC